MTRDSLVWGIEAIASRFAPHFAAVGTTGSGKTLTLNALMRSALMPSPEGLLRARALVHDHKTELYPTLRGIGVGEEDIHVLHSFDERSSAWNLAGDVRSRADAAQVAKALIPTPSEQRNLFFYEASRNILREVIYSLHSHAPGEWLLHDLVEIALDDEHLARALKSTPEGQRLFRRVFGSGNPRTASDVCQTIETKLQPLATAALLWTHASRSVTLEEWVASRSVLLLPHRPEYSESVTPLNRALLTLLCSKLCSRANTTTDPTWLFLDEFRALGAFEGFDEVMLTGRAKGARVAIGFQDIQGLRHTWGRERADEILEQCGNVALLRMNSPESIEWAYRYVGETEYDEYSESWGRAGNQSSSTTTHRVASRATIMRHQFRTLPLAGPQHGVPGWFYIPGFPGQFLTNPSWGDIVNFLPQDSSDPAFLARPLREQEAPLISEARLAELGLQKLVGRAGGLVNPFEPA